mmetsp:Transcript_29171/g.69247  ORF Transcript_29171/g.69247 Transcript_29171/m.69247 type:complete len:378 (+) Transcript_29171:2308-3441(+)
MAALAEQLEKPCRDVLVLHPAPDLVFVCPDQKDGRSSLGLGVPGVQMGRVHPELEEALALRQHLGAGCRRKPLHAERDHVDGFPGHEKVMEGVKDLLPAEIPEQDTEGLFATALGVLEHQRSVELHRADFLAVQRRRRGGCCRSRGLLPSLCRRGSGCSGGGGGRRGRRGCDGALGGLGDEVRRGRILLADPLHHAVRRLLQPLSRAALAPQLLAHSPRCRLLQLAPAAIVRAPLASRLQLRLRHLQRDVVDAHCAFQIHLVLLSLQRVAKRRLPGSALADHADLGVAERGGGISLNGLPDLCYLAFLRRHRLRSTRVLHLLLGLFFCLALGLLICLGLAPPGSSSPCFLLFCRSLRSSLALCLGLGLGLRLGNLGW